METGKDQTQIDFEAARRQAFWNELGAFLSGRPNRLLSWSKVRDELDLRGLVYQGVQAVPLAQIIGSVERYQDFDRAFMPKRDQIAPRWRSIASAHYSNTSLPPVTLHKVGDAYFVVDGHHRVSVARERGHGFVDAKVIEAEARVPVTAELDAADLKIKGEYARFLERTRLDVLRPGQDVEFTAGGAYECLLERIAVHRHRMALEQQRQIPEDEAVGDWYDHAYLPLVRIIREQGILVAFPGRTEADLYLWIMDHQHVLREQCGPDVDTERAAAHFADRRAAPRFKRVVRAIRDWAASFYKRETAGTVCDLPPPSTGARHHSLKGHSDGTLALEPHDG